MKRAPNKLFTLVNAYIEKATVPLLVRLVRQYVNSILLLHILIWNLFCLWNLKFLERSNLVNIIQAYLVFERISISRITMSIELIWIELKKNWIQLNWNNLHNMKNVKLLKIEYMQVFYF